MTATKRDSMCLDCRDGNTRACDPWPYPCSERKP